VVLDYRSDGSITICLPERDIVSPFDSGRAKLLSGSYLALVRQVWASRDRRELDTLSRQLYDLLWKPVESHVTLRKATVYIKSNDYLFQFPLRASGAQTDSSENDSKSGI
jgi:hypothetical protein